MGEALSTYRACTDLGGVATTRELRALGCTERDLRRAVLDGNLLRVRPGTYADPALEPAELIAVRHGGRIGCISGLVEEGLWILDPPEQVHVAMAPNGRSRKHPECTCVAHWSKGGGRPSLVEAFAQVYGCLDDEAFFVALESALRLGKIDRSALRRLRERVPAEARKLIDEARADADSGLESLLRFRLRRDGIILWSQVEVPGVGRVDFVVGDRLILEVDGTLGHVGKAERHKDLLRDAVAAAHGFDTLRFDYALIVHDWELVRAAILKRIEHGLHRRAKPASAR